MKISWNQKTNLPNFQFEESDYLDAQHIQEMIQGEFLCRKCGTRTENRGWNILENYYRAARESILDKLKAFARTRAKKDLCSNLASMLDGFDTAFSVPQKVVLQAEVDRIRTEKDRKAMEATNDEPGNEYGD